MDVLENKILINQDNLICTANQALENAKIIVFYFSSSWCKRAVHFLPKIRKVYDEAKKRGIALEIVFVSLDTDPSDMNQHFKMQGNWWSLVFGDTTIWELVNRFNITFIPAAIVVKPDGKVITRAGINEVEEIDINVLVTWDY